MNTYSSVIMHIRASILFIVAVPLRVTNNIKSRIIDPHTKRPYIHENIEQTERSNHWDKFVFFIKTVYTHELTIMMYTDIHMSSVH